jgi:hypothetical protein
MIISPEIDTFITVLRERVAHRDQHYLLPEERRILYRMFEAHSEADIRGWLAIIAAQRVLPIFEQEIPEEKVPRIQLYLASKVERGVIPLDSWQVRAYFDYGYTSAGDDWGYIISKTVRLAGFAAHRALAEVIGYNPLDLISDGERDELFVGTNAMDTAGTAAYAAASIDYNDPEIRNVYNYDRLFTFWEWWLREAIPQAWEKILLHP